MVWTIDMDDYLGTFCNQGKYPLINVLRKAFGVDKLGEDNLPTHILSSPLSISLYLHFFTSAVSPVSLGIPKRPVKKVWEMYESYMKATCVSNSFFNKLCNLN